jgi:NTE family protein
MDHLRNQNVALVLSGGGARGIAHIGVIEELERRGFKITSIAGTSMGSLIGGVYAAGKLKELKEWIYTLDKGKIFRMVDFTLSKQGLIKGDKVLKKMKDYIPDTNIEELPLPFAAVAVDLISRREVVFREGSLYHAIRASIAIPSVFTPVKEDHRLLVDGGVLNNIPLEYVERIDGDKLIAVNVNADIPARKPVVLDMEGEAKQSSYLHKTREFYSHLRKSNPGAGAENLGYFALLTRTLDLMTARMADTALQMHTPDILMNISRDSCTMYDFYKAEEMVETGRRVASESLDQIH